MFRNLTDERLKAEVAEEVKYRTKLYAERNGYAEPDFGKDASEKAKGLSRALGHASFGAYAPSFAALLTAIVGEKIVATSKDNPKFIGGSAIVVTGNSNGHNYKDGATVIGRMAHAGDYFMRVNGEMGNHMGPLRSDSRPATDAEIDAFIKEANKEAVKGILYEFFVGSPV